VTDPEKLKMNKDDLHAITFNSIKQLNTKMIQENDELKKEIQDLKNRLEKIEKLIISKM